MTTAEEFLDVFTFMKNNEASACLTGIEADDEELGQQASSWSSLDVKKLKEANVHLTEASPTFLCESFETSRGLSVQTNQRLQGQEDP